MSTFDAVPRAKLTSRTFSEDADIVFLTETKSADPGIAELSERYEVSCCDLACDVPLSSFSPALLLGRRPEER